LDEDHIIYFFVGVRLCGSVANPWCFHGKLVYESLYSSFWICEINQKAQFISRCFEIIEYLGFMESRQFLNGLYLQNNSFFNKDIHKIFADDTAFVFYG